MMKLNAKGFTLVELLIAMAFFTFLLLLVTFGFVQINRSYTRGITVKTIQETARSLTEDISRALRTTENYEFIPSNDVNNGFHLCISDTRYIWNQHIEQPTAQDNKTLVMTQEKFSPENEDFTMVRAADGKGCNQPVAKADAEEILDDRAAIQHLSIEPIGSGTGTYKITIVVSTRQAVESDLAVFGKNAQCKVQVGNQFCDVARYETVVQTRN